MSNDVKLQVLYRRDARQCVSPIPKPRPNVSSNFQNPQNSICKFRYISILKNNCKINVKSHCQNGKTGYFCTRNNADVPRNPDKPTKSKRKVNFQKRFKKACEIRKRMLFLHPAKRVTFLERLTRKR